MKLVVMGHGFQLHKGTPESSGLDIRNTFEGLTVTKGKSVKVGLGIKSAVPQDHVAVIAPRSGLGSNGLQVCNTLGFIDTDYRGEWFATLTLADWAKESEMVFKRGDKFLQVFVIHASTAVDYVEQLDETERGEGGFGHTGVE